jgi:hypothetical protein
VIGAIDTLGGSSDIISGFYLGLSIYLLYKSKWQKNRNQIWWRVNTFNIIILTAQIIF